MAFLEVTRNRRVLTEIVLLQMNDTKSAVTDYSTIHHSTGALFHNDQVGDWRQYELSEEQVAQYWSQGFISNVRILTDEQCQKLCRHYDIFLGKEDHEGLGLLHEHKLKLGGCGDSSDSTVMHCAGHWRVSELFHDLAFLPSITVPVSQLLEEGKKHVPVRFFNDQLFAKPAKHGKFLAWHQDFLQWPPTQPISHITVQVALDDQYVENGALAYVPESHRWRHGVPLELRDFKTQEMEALKEHLVEEELAAWREVFALLKSGECSFHHPLSVHCSYGNQMDKIRRSAVLHYMSDGVASDSDDVLLAKTDCRIPVGQQMSGQFFPLVFQPTVGPSLGA